MAVSLYRWGDWVLLPRRLTQSRLRAEADAVRVRATRRGCARAAFVPRRRMLCRCAWHEDRGAVRTGSRTAKLSECCSPAQMGVKVEPARTRRSGAAQSPRRSASRNSARSNAAKVCAKTLPALCLSRFLFRLARCVENPRGAARLGARARGGLAILSVEILKCRDFKCRDYLICDYLTPRWPESEIYI